MGSDVQSCHHYYFFIETGVFFVVKVMVIVAVMVYFVNWKIDSFINVEKKGGVCVSVVLLAFSNGIIMLILFTVCKLLYLSKRRCINKNR